MPEKRKRSPWRRVGCISGVIIALMIAAAVFARWYPSTMDRDIEAIHKMGYPTTDADVAALFPPLEGENSQIYYDQAAEIKRKWTPNERSDFNRFIYDRLSSMTTADMRKYAAEFSALQAPLMKASLALGWKSSKPLPRPSSSNDFSGQTSATQTVRFLTRCAVVDERAHNVPASLGKLEECARIEAMSSKFSRLEGGLTPISCETQIMNALVDLLHNNPDARTLGATMKFVDSLPPPPSFMKMFESDAVATFDDYRMANTSDDHGDFVAAFKRKFWDDPHEQRQHNFDVHMIRTIFEEMPKDTSNMVAVHQFFSDFVAKHFKELGRYPESDVPLGMKFLSDHWIGQEAYRRVMRMSIRMLQAKIQSGVYPSSLGSFYGQDAIDPFTGAGLVYKPTAKGFLLYSVGPDRTDNGGLPRERSRSYDIVFQSP
jgi:hypothetical protein